MEYANLSVEEIKRQLDEAEQKKNELSQMLKQRREDEKDSFLQQIRDLILNNGYNYSDIVPLIEPKRGRGRARIRDEGVGKAPSDRKYRRYVDPDNPSNTYKRGVLPAWMKQKMEEHGYDPSKKEDREAFKTNTLRLVED